MLRESEERWEREEMKDDAEVIEDKPTYTSPSFIDIPEEDREKETEEERTLRTSPRVVETAAKKRRRSDVLWRPITTRVNHKMLWLCPPENPMVEFRSTPGQTTG